MIQREAIEVAQLRTEPFLPVVQIDAERGTITIGNYTYALQLLAGGLVTAPKRLCRIDAENGKLTVHSFGGPIVEAILAGHGMDKPTRPPESAEFHMPPATPPARIRQTDAAATFARLPEATEPTLERVSEPSADHSFGDVACGYTGPEAVELTPEPTPELTPEASEPVFVPLPEATEPSPERASEPFQLVETGGCAPPVVVAADPEPTPKVEGPLPEPTPPPTHSHPDWLETDREPRMPRTVKRREIEPAKPAPTPKVARAAPKVADRASKVANPAPKVAPAPKVVPAPQQVAHRTGPKPAIPLAALAPRWCEQCDAKVSPTRQAFCKSPFCSLKGSTND